MASSPESRPADVAEAAAVEDHTETPNSADEEPARKEDGESKTQADESADAPTVEPKFEPTQASEKTGDEEAEKKRDDTEQASDEPLIPKDTAAAAANVDAPASPPPLPDEPLPDEADTNDDGWDPMWSDEHQAWYFVNRFTQQTQWENPRVPDAAQGAAGGGGESLGGYNPAVHGDYDPNAWYAKGEAAPSSASGVAVTGVDVDGGDPIAAAAAAAAAIIQGDAANTNGARYGHDAKASRQLNGFFDVAATNGAHDGRSLKAERSGIKPSKSELKAFKEKRRARKEEKRRAWLRD